MVFTFVIRKTSTMKIFGISIFLFALIGLAACQKTAVSTSDCTGTTPTYLTNVKSILDSKCVSCHSTGNQSGGIDLSNYSSCKNAKDKIVGSVQHASGFSAMPQGGAKLDDATIKTINCWSQNGAPE